jgi:4-hydroxy-3-methylbut-2-en-1-yl diphosphate synthase IspG/GcpE
LQDGIDRLETAKQINVALMGCVVNGPGEAKKPISASPAEREKRFCSGKAKSSGKSAKTRLWRHF